MTSIVQEIFDACQDFQRRKGEEPKRVFLGKAEWDRIMKSNAAELRREARALPDALHGSNWYYTDTPTEIRVE